jgi:membrane-associated phospholipid phosphatase
MSFDDTADAPDWRVWGFTAVIYQRGDYVSFIMCLLSLAPQVLIVAFLAVNFTAFHRRFIGMHACMLISEAINKIMKETFREVRPAHPCPFAARQDYGFPSSHAQLMFLFATYSAFILLRSSPRIGGSDDSTVASPRKKAMPAAIENINHSERTQFTWQRVCIVIGLYIVAVLVSVSRVWNYYHTTKQVVVGGAVGTVLGVLFSTVPPFVRMIERAVLWLERTNFFQSWYAMVGIAPIVKSQPGGAALYSKQN